MCNIIMPKIKILGIGGAGCNIVNLLLKKEIKSLEYFIADSDEETLNLSICENKIKVLTKGESSMDMMHDIFWTAVKEADLVIIVGGLGGDIGSTFIPVLAEEAHKLAIKTVAVVATPFEFEGKARMAKCVESLEKLKAFTDTVIVVPNHKVKKIVPKSTSMRTALSVIDTVIYEAVNCIASSICEPNVINVEYEDVVSILKGGGLAYLGVGIGEGENNIQDTIERAIHNPLSSTEISTAKRVLLSVTGGIDLDLQNATMIAEAVHNAVDADANIVFSVKIEQNWTSKIRIAIIGLAEEQVTTVEPKVEVHIEGIGQNINYELKNVLTQAEELALKFNTSYIASEHIVYAMLLTDCKAGELLNSCGCVQELYERFFVKSLSFDVAIKGYTPRTKFILQHTREDVILKKDYNAEAGTEHVLYKIISCDSLACKILSAMGVNMRLLKDMLEEAIGT